jgi:hypothetical protein
MLDVNKVIILEFLDISLAGFSGVHLHRHPSPVSPELGRRYPSGSNGLGGFDNPTFDENTMF